MHIADMTLSDWMKTNTHTDASLARLVKRDRTAISRWRRGKVKPDWDALEKLATVTKGQVTAADFMTPEVAAE